MIARHLNWHDFTMAREEAPPWGYEPDPFYEPADRAAARASPRESRHTTLCSAPDTFTKGAEHAR